MGQADCWEGGLPRVEDEPFVRDILGFPAPDSEPLAPPEPEPGDEEEEGEGEESLSSRKDWQMTLSEVQAAQQGVNINFKAIEKRLNANERTFVSEAKGDLEQVLIILQRSVRPGQQPNSIQSIRGMSPLKESLRVMLTSAFYDGLQDLASEVGASKKFQALPRVKPRDAIAFLKRKAIVLTDALEAEILRDVRQLLISGVEQGMSTVEVTTALGVIFEKWLGSDVLRKGQAVSPYRLEAIARTNCLVGETLVSGAVVRAAYRRWYDGSVVDVVTKGGRKFTATPNHPMLSRRGWVGAGAVRAGPPRSWSDRNSPRCAYRDRPSTPGIARVGRRG
jgi:hypothetical protein